MQVLTVQLERLFDVQHRSGNHPHVQFSCIADGKRHLSVQLPGSPRLEVGDRITVVLRSPGNWQSIAGWKNHANGEVLLPGSMWLVVAPVVGLLTLATGWFFLTADSSGQRMATGAAFVGLLLAALVVAEQAKATLRASQLLGD